MDTGAFFLILVAQNLRYIVYLIIMVFYLMNTKMLAL